MAVAMSIYGGKNVLPVREKKTQCLRRSDIDLRGKGAKLRHPLENGKKIRPQATFSFQTTSTLIFNRYSLSWAGVGTFPKRKKADALNLNNSKTKWGRNQHIFYHLGFFTVEYIEKLPQIKKYRLKSKSMWIWGNKVAAGGFFTIFQRVANFCTLLRMKWIEK